MCFVDRLKQGSAVKTEVFRFRTLTPLLMHGWQKESRRGTSTPLGATVRIPSIRGVLRYWWRTLQPYESQSELLAKEKKFFGGVGGNDQGMRSPVAFRLERPIHSQESAPITPHKGKRPTTKAIFAGQTIHLVMSHHHKALQLQEEHRLYIQYMLLLAGFGQRARRGAGAVQYSEFRWDTLVDVQETLRQLLVQLQRGQLFFFPSAEAGLLLQRQSAEVPRHPFLNAIWVGRSYADAEEARRAISEAGKRANPPNRTQYLGHSKGKDRLASPLHATVRQVGEVYVPIITEVTSSYTADLTSGADGYLAAREQFLRFLGVNV